MVISTPFDNSFHLNRLYGFKRFIYKSQHAGWKSISHHLKNKIVFYVEYNAKKSNYLFNKSKCCDPVDRDWNGCASNANGKMIGRNGENLNKVWSLKVTRHSQIYTTNDYEWRNGKKKSNLKHHLKYRTEYIMIWKRSQKQMIENRLRWKIWHLPDELEKLMSLHHCFNNFFFFTILKGKW